MERPSKHSERRALGRVSVDTKGATGPDIEMIGLWHKPALTR
jgi:hypothetical protein